MQFRLLVLEDDPDLRDALAECLSDQGYDVVAVGRGEDAVLQASQSSFDLIVADVRMPGMNGLTAIEEAKKHQPDLKAVVVSGYASEDETLRAIQLDVGAYLRKPFSIPDFLRHVKQQLERRVAESQKHQQLRALQNGLAWSWNCLVRVVDELALLGPPGSLQRVGRVSRQMAERAGLPAELADQVRLAVLLGALQAHPTTHVPLEELSGALGPVAGLLTQGGGSLPGRLVALGLDAWKAREGDALPSPDTLRETHGDLVELYTESQLDPPEPVSPPEIVRGLGDPRRVERSLLALGRTLEDGGDLESAERAYRQVADTGSRAAAAQAWLGLARVAAAQGHKTEVLSATREIHTQAAPLGPAALVPAQLEAGLLLLQAGFSEARELLEQAAAGLASLGLAGPEARARLGLMRAGVPQQPAELGRAMARLLEPAHRTEVADSAAWMLPTLLRLGREQGTAADGPGLLRLVVDFSAELARAVGELERDDREFLLGLLESSPRAVPGDLLETLAQDPLPELRERSEALRRRGQGAPVPPLLRTYSLGFFRAYLGTEVLPEAGFKTQKVKYLLAFLAAHGTARPAREEVVIENFWPEGNYKRNLYFATTTLRGCLRAERASAFDFLVRSRDGFSLNGDLPQWHDIQELEAALRQGAEAERSGDAQQMLAHLRRAATLYQGPYLDGCYMEWAVRRRRQLEETITGSLAKLAFHCAQNRLYEEALQHATRATELDAASLEAHQLRMRALLGLGRHEQAVRHFEACERVLRKEYDLEPSLELLEVYQRARYGMPDVASA